MQSKTTNLSIDPANNDSLEGAFRQILNKAKQSTDGMLPAQIISYDRETNRATVQPLVKMQLTDGSFMSRSQINNIPVILLGGGGYMISFPLKSGDLGWVLASDRDISNFLQSYSNSNPNTLLVKDFSNSVFIPDVMKGYTISGGDSQNLVIQSLSGDVKITFGTNTLTLEAENIDINATTDLNLNAQNINITATNDLNLNSQNTNITASNKVTIDATNVDINSIVNITGSLFVNGNPIG